MTFTLHPMFSDLHFEHQPCQGCWAPKYFILLACESDRTFLYTQCFFFYHFYNHRLAGSWKSYIQILCHSSPTSTRVLFPMFMLWFVSYWFSEKSITKSRSTHGQLNPSTILFIAEKSGNKLHTWFVDLCRTCSIKWQESIFSRICAIWNICRFF
jgi:hypothetical protein